MRCLFFLLFFVSILSSAESYNLKNITFPDSDISLNLPDYYQYAAEFNAYIPDYSIVKEGAFLRYARKAKNLKNSVDDYKEFFGKEGFKLSQIKPLKIDGYDAHLAEYEKKVDHSNKAESDLYRNLPENSVSLEHAVWSVLLVSNSEMMHVVMANTSREGKQYSIIQEAFKTFQIESEQNLARSYIKGYGVNLSFILPDKFKYDESYRAYKSNYRDYVNKGEIKIAIQEKDSKSSIALLEEIIKEYMGGYEYRIKERKKINLADGESLLLTTNILAYRDKNKQESNSIMFNNYTLIIEEHSHVYVLNGFCVMGSFVCDEIEKSLLSVRLESQTPDAIV